ncbi:MAG: hypothetical protein HY738_22330 [Bacteroidia bacterium]|nr:hypothetical protein [Bacteroidia bacterium]
MKKYILITLTALFMLFVAHSQTITDILNRTDLNFYQKAGLIEQNNRQVFNNSSLPEQKRYTRWFSFWFRRIDTQGNHTAYPMLVMNYLKNKSKSLDNPNTIFPVFQQFGPYENLMYQYEGTSPAEAYKNNIGVAQSVLVHPTDPNIVYVGGRYGGIFKTTNALASNPADVQWVNITDNYFGIGVNE